LVNIVSPCVRNCCLNEQGICLGCFRSIDEILQWKDAAEQQKQEIINLANARKIEYRLKYRAYFDSIGDRKVGWAKTFRRPAIDDELQNDVQRTVDKKDV
jgi:predicted Fe-S protein YdhL (DUF1289 family)